MSLAFPIWVMRLSTITMRPFSITSSPRIVAMRAPEITVVPCGLSAVSVKPIFTPCSAGLGNSAGAPGTKAKASFKSRVNNSSPNAK